MCKNFIFLFLLWQGLIGAVHGQMQVTTVESGIQRIVYGDPDKLTPYSFCENKPLAAEIAALPKGDLPFGVNDIKIRVNDRGTVVEIPLEDDEQLYGLGMQIGSFNQRGLKKRPIVNDNPLNDLGYTHGPTTFYLSNKGYGILINTARYTTFYFGTTSKLNSMAAGGGGNLVFKPLPPGDPKQRKPDITRAQNLLGWQPRVSLNQGLVETIAYFRKVIS